MRTDITMSVDTSSFFGTSITAVKFEKIGDFVQGEVLDKELRQQTDSKTGRLRSWPDGRPKLVVVITLQVEEPEEDDDGQRNLYVRGYMQKAVIDALKALHLKDVVPGMHLKITFKRQDDPAKTDQDGAKHYAAEIWTVGEVPPWK